MQNYSFLQPCRNFIQYRFYDKNRVENIINNPFDNISNGFAPDLDNIICSIAFRRLSSKTQIFYSQEKDDLRTRLTHTLEVAHIAKRISKALGLDTELTEAIALGHDVGHTPFGHVGERTLNIFSCGEDKKQSSDKQFISKNSKGFKHNLQAVRTLVEYSGDLKFSNYMLFGVREHSKQYWFSPNDVSYYDYYDKFCSCEIEKKYYPVWSFEAYIVKWADEIAQRHHDIEDAYYQKIMTAEEIYDVLMPLSKVNEMDCTRKKYERIKQEIELMKKEKYIDYRQKFMDAVTVFTVDSYVNELLKVISYEMDMFCKNNKIYSQKDFNNKYLSIDICNIREIFKLENSSIFNIDSELGETLKHNILDSFQVQKMDGKGSYVVRKLVRAYLSNPQQLPDDYINRLIKIDILKRTDDEKINILKNRLLSKLPKYKIENVLKLKNYECREVLRVLMEEPECRSIIYEKLLRIVIGYVAEMTDKFAMNRYSELY